MLLLSLPVVVGFAANPWVSVDDLCEALVTYANDGCSEDKTRQEKPACVAELSVFSRGDGLLSTQEAIAALDAIPDTLTKALGAVDVGATCLRERLRSIINDEIRMQSSHLGWYAPLSHYPLYRYQDLYYFLALGTVRMGPQKSCLMAKIYSEIYHIPQLSVFCALKGS